MIYFVPLQVLLKDNPHTTMKVIIYQMFYGLLEILEFKTEFMLVFHDHSEDEEINFIRLNHLHPFKGKKKGFYESIEKKIYITL